MKRLQHFDKQRKYKKNTDDELTPEEEARIIEERLKNLELPLNYKDLV